VYQVHFFRENGDEKKRKKRVSFHDQESFPSRRTQNLQPLWSVAVRSDRLNEYILKNVSTTPSPLYETPTVTVYPSVTHAPTTIKNKNTPIAQERPTTYNRPKPTFFFRHQKLTPKSRLDQPPFWDASNKSGHPPGTLPTVCMKLLLTRAHRVTRERCVSDGYSWCAHAYREKKTTIQYLEKKTMCATYGI
jgi:hypothetical protein